MTFRARARALVVVGAVGVVGAVLVVPHSAGPGPGPTSSRGPVTAATDQPPPSPSNQPGAGAAVPDLLDRELIDLAVLAPAAPRGDARLLTVARQPIPTEQIRLEVLERSQSRWSPRAEAAMPAPAAGIMDTPWLVALGEDRFVLLAVVPSLRETWLRTVDWTGDALRLGEPVVVRRPIDDAGVADVDGDGIGELVLVEAATRRGGPLCQDSTLVVADPRSLAIEREVRVPNLRLGPGVMGALDEVPGDDVVTVAERNCPAGPSSAQRMALVVIRLADGTVLHDWSLRAADPVSAWAGRPGLADIELDGRPEILVGSRGGLVVVSPQRDWEVRQLDVLPGVLLGLRGAGEHEPVRPLGPAVTVATMDERALRVGEVRRSGDGWLVVYIGRLTAGRVGSAAWDAAEFDRRNASLRLRGGTAWLSSEDCPSLVVPLAVVSCFRDVPAVVRQGSPWLATRPLADLDGGARLLVARTERWSGLPGRLTSPSPLASEPAGRHWRHGPSFPFRLAEVDAAGLADPNAEAPSLGLSAGGDPPELPVGALAGSRLLAVIAGDAERETFQRSSLTGLLARAARGDLTASFGLLPSQTRSTTETVLALPVQKDRAPGDRVWTIGAASVGPLGDVSSLARGVVEQDVDAPAIDLPAPFVSPPWPLTAGLSGTTEPGAVVIAGDGEQVAGADGRFTIATPLAPWPQRIEVLVRDRVGNEATMSVDVIGGLDYRQLPWPLILLVGLVAAAVLGPMRKAASVAQPLAAGTTLAGPGAPEDDDDGERPVLEELYAGRIASGHGDR